MRHIHLDRIISHESPPKAIKIFSEKEIKMIQELFQILPERTFNKKQNIRKKAWEQNYNKELDKIYISNSETFFQSQILGLSQSEFDVALYLNSDTTEENNLWSSISDHRMVATRSVS